MEIDGENLVKEVQTPHLQNYHVCKFCLMLEIFKKQDQMWMNKMTIYE